MTSIHRRRAAALLRCAAGLLVAAAALLVPCTAAHAAAVGTVDVFVNEFARVRVYENPDGCYALPVAAHVLVNLTDGRVQIYADPACALPLLTVRPGYGSHVSAVGSFSA